MSKWDLPVSVLRAPRPDDENSQPRRSRPKRGCKASGGGEHVLMTRLNRRTESLMRYPHKQSAPLRNPPCGWSPWAWRFYGDWHYTCRHEQYCTRCGKIVALTPDRCPAYGPKPAISAEQAAKQRTW